MDPWSATGPTSSRRYGILELPGTKMAGRHGHQPPAQVTWGLNFASRAATAPPARPGPLRVRRLVHADVVAWNVVDARPNETGAVAVSWTQGTQGGG